MSTDSHPLQLETDEIPWSSSSSSSGGIPEFSTRALPFEPITDQQIVLDYLHQSIPTLRTDQPLQSPSDPASQGNLGVSRRGTADIIARYRLIMDANERLRNRRVAQSSHQWMYIWARMYGRPYAEAVDRRLRPFVNQIMHQVRVSFEHLDQLCEEVTAMVQAANSGEAIDAAFTRFFNEARQRRMSVILQRARARMARLVQTGLPEWPRFVDAFFALDLDGGYSVGRAPVDLAFLRHMNAWPGSRLAAWAGLAILQEILRGWYVSDW